jgi:hypothetical protein
VLSNRRGKDDSFLENGKEFPQRPNLKPAERELSQLAAFSNDSAAAD